MRHRRSFVVGAFAVAIAIAAVWLAPAALVDAQLARISEGTVRLIETDGTVWRARGVIVAGNARIPIGWRAEPWPLLQGELRVHVTPGSGQSGGPPRADITIQRNTLSLRDVELNFPASVIATIAGRRAPYAIGGDIHVGSAALTLAQGSSQGDVQVLWRSARIALLGGMAPLDLGDVRCALQARGDRLAGPISNEDGDLDVRGDVTLQEHDSLQVALLLAPRRSDDQQLATALSAIATREGDRWRINLRVPLR